MLWLIVKLFVTQAFEKKKCEPKNTMRRKESKQLEMIPTMIRKESVVSWFKRSDCVVA